ncbi:hypothetical protein GCM10011506_34810 [Marivirga lumbricoides]|uniref:Uncharacterized protein n=1 Tax=Marivirga lumbricoides TaxID=1046115 RepID=A0ABQ1MU96_9BACT|nr:hypothetical protein GCM10011506_34810 [Marivirga lumbricoides]
MASSCSESIIKSCLFSSDIIQFILNAITDFLIYILPIASVRLADIKDYNLSMDPGRNKLLVGFEGIID